MQVVYGLRIHEAYLTKDGVSIPALNDLDNSENVIVLGAETLMGTTTKTGYRLARPQVPPKYPDLIGKLGIKTSLFPANKPRSISADTIRKFYCNKATEQLRRWNAPTTETHAFRHLANINGMQAGIPQETCSKVNKGHERIEKRKVSTMKSNLNTPGWLNIQTIIKVESQRQTRYAIESQTRYYICDLIETASDFALACFTVLRPRLCIRYT
ncbi:MAG: hypothetical protein RLZZ535_85 [Cyanobacteriota bacterium]|jgi:hypothetical protein